MKLNLLLALLALLFVACNTPINSLASKRQDKKSSGNNVPNYRMAVKVPVSYGTISYPDATIQLTLDDKINAENIRKAMAGKIPDSVIEVAIKKISALLPKDRDRRL